MTTDEFFKKFSKGTRVRLNIGGPDMSIKSVTTGVIVCQWFVGKKLESGQFAPESLLVVAPGDENPKV